MIKKVLYFPMILVIYFYMTLARDHMTRDQRIECESVLDLYWHGGNSEQAKS